MRTLKLGLIAAAVLLASCDRTEPDMGPHLVVVDTGLRNEICAGRHACAPTNKDGVQYALLAEYKDLPAGTYTVTVPEDIVWPPVVAKNHHDTYKERRCGMIIAEHNGFYAGWNGAGHLCHEVMHLAGFSH